MEIHSNLYLRNPNARVQSLFNELLEICDLNSPQRIADIEERKKKLIEISTLINPEKGKTLALELIELFDAEGDPDFGSESISENAGFCVSHWVNGSGGIEIQEGLMYFFNGLDAETHVQSWSCGDDDPVECWSKVENGVVKQTSDKPYSEQDEYIYGTAYHWWHSDMPRKITEGYLNDDDYSEICEEYCGKVFFDKAAPIKISDAQYNKWIQEAVYDRPGKDSISEKTQKSCKSPGSEKEWPTEEELICTLDDVKKIMRFPISRYWYQLKGALRRKKF